MSFLCKTASTLIRYLNFYFLFVFFIDFPSFQGVRPFSAGLKSDLGRRGGLVGVWRDGHQQPLGPEPWQKPGSAAGPGEHKRWDAVMEV